MLDLLGRDIDYMRISITDRCNLRCKYCMPEDGVRLISHGDVLSYEEILRLCGAAVKAGIRNFKVTGGEPLVRRGCMRFLSELKSAPGIENVTLTTNGVLLEPHAGDLAKMKLDGVNISLDSLRADTYMQITGRDGFPAVWRSLNKAVEAGLRVKINFVPLAGQNDEEILPVARLAESLPVDVRFIEFMPATGAGMGFERVDGAVILERLLEAYPDLAQDERRRGFGPARYFKSSKMRGSVGLISAVGDCFCPDCNRVRLTSDGFLKLCLFHDDGLDLRRMLRSGADDNEIEAAFAGAVRRKPERYPTGPDTGIKNMSRIGG